MEVDILGGPVHSLPTTAFTNLKTSVETALNATCAIVSDLIECPCTSAASMGDVYFTFNELGGSVA